MSKNEKKNIFYILALSQKHVSFYECGRESIHEIQLKNLPKNFVEVEKNDRLEKQLQSHSCDGKHEMFHGHGVGSKHHKDNMFNYFCELDKCLHEYLKDKNAPLFLATVDYLYPIYKDANSYKYLSDKFIEGNADKVIPKVLHKEALKLLFLLLEV